MKKVLVVGMTQNPGGIENVIMNYYRNIDRNSIQFEFLCNTEIVAYQDEIIKLKGKIIKIPSRSKNFFKYKKALKKFFSTNANQYSAIWVNFCNLTNLDYLKLAKKYGIKKRIIHSHNSQSMYSKIIDIIHNYNKNFIDKYATDFWACSKEASEWFYNDKVVKNHKIVIINNAIDLDKFSYNEKTEKEYRKKLNIDDKIVIGHVGRFHKQKNHDFLIEIFSEIAKQNEKACLLLIGQGEKEVEIKEKVKKLNLEDKVIFLGARNDIAELMQAMDVFLFPSIFEGLGLVLIEAQVAGIPVIASKNVIPNEVKMTNGFIFVSLQKSANEWAEIVLQQIKTKKQNQKNIEYIRKNGYDIKNEVKKMQQYFEGD